MFSKFLQAYLKFWATQYLRRAKPKIIAITGSVGKTSAKEAIFLCLKQKFTDSVDKSSGNLNTETGVPLAILGFTKSPKNFLSWILAVFLVPTRVFRKKYQFLVLELAADKPGDIKYLTSFIKPYIAVITQIAPSHLANYKNLEHIAEEKTSLLWALEPEGWAVLNIDNEFLRKASFGGRFQKLTYAIHAPADIQAKNIKTKFLIQPETTFETTGKINSQFISYTLGAEANVYASLAAISVSTILNLSEQEIQHGIEAIAPEKHRMQVLLGKNKTTIIDDCYNANPASMKNALTVLKNLKPGKEGRKIAILGDMREIGKTTIEEHKKIGVLAKESADVVIAVGDLARRYNAYKFFGQTDKAIDYLLKELRPGDILLIKASRSVRLEKIVDALSLH